MTRAPSAATVAKALTPAGKGFLTSQLFLDGPRPGPALSADTSFSPARQLDRLELAERVNDRRGSNWYYLTPLGWRARRLLQEAE